MKKTLAALLAVSSLVVAGAPAAQADGRGVAAGIAGGLIGGAIIGGAIAASRPAPVYAAPAPVYVEERPCHWRRERFWDGYEWRFRRVEVCH